MNRYKLSKLVPGYKVKPSLKDKKLLALPWEVKEPTRVILSNGESSLLNQESRLLHKQEFKDKFGRDKTYTLHYYEYVDDQPTNQTKLF
tara:strand:+ start:145 stop:411 length:267 start_codon:yes stop_codon:yes gene_type:complete